MNHPDIEIVEVEVGWQGPKGSPGNDASRQTYSADAPLGGHRAVIRTATGIDYADAGTAAHCGRVIGLTTDACAAGDAASVQMVGDLEEPSWNWMPEMPVFVGTNGLLTQVAPAAPASRFSQVIGVAITPIKLFVQLREPFSIV